MQRLVLLTLVVLTTLLCIAPLSTSAATSPIRRRTFQPRDPLTAHYNRNRVNKPSTTATATTTTPLTPTDTTYNWTTSTYTNQYIDHFGFTQTNTFDQRYLINTHYWRPPTDRAGPGPIFFYCGNEGYIETFAGNSGFMFDIAAEYGALLLFVEHRYYGHSFPFGDAETAYANTTTLQYLTSEQAIADYVQFLTWFKSDVSTPCMGMCVDVPVIGFGGSYGGMLSSWMRIKYPHILSGAIAASAPIWQFYGLVAPTVYNHIITRDYTLDTPYCAAGIQKTWDIIEAMSQTEKGLQQLTNIFKPCNTSVFTPETVGSIYGFLSEAFGYMAMADYPYPAEFLGPMPAYPVSYGCTTYFTNVDPSSADNVTVLEAVYGVASVFWNFTGEAGQCNDMGAQGPSTLGSQDGWDYQCCTEMVQAIGQYGGSNDMFWYAPFNLQASIEYCQLPMDQGGWGTTPRPEWVIEEYGGIHIEAASRIFFSSGGLDPWSGLTPNATALNGAYSPANPRGVVAYFMNHTAHHLDLRGSNPADPTEVKRVRDIERAYITAWLNDKDRPRMDAVDAIERYWADESAAATQAVDSVKKARSVGLRAE